ncbi:MAG: carbohydrate kinase [Abditibacteriota bacterium]|nr:carbohydrate kinase [Abditibacteriota bacterium]
MTDVVCLGELLIDFTTLKSGESVIESECFTKNAGGSPANTCAGVAALGGKAAFLGKVGNDSFGKYLYKVLEDKGVDVTGLRLSDEAMTKLAFVDNITPDERRFIFYGKPSADELYSEDDLETGILADAKIFHFGSISLVNDCVYQAAVTAAGIARSKGALISYDPNIRLNMWPSESAARQRSDECVRMADIVKLSDEEMEVVTGTNDIDEALDMLNLLGVKIAVITRGGKGVAYRWGSVRGFVPSYDVVSRDATGAGDSFAAGLLFQIARQNKPVTAYDESLIRGVIAFAAKVAAIVVTKPGAIPAMPSFEEVADSPIVLKQE